MGKEHDDLADMLSGIIRQGQRIKEAPLTQDVRALMEEVNKEALEGKGEFSASLGRTPTDTTFSLSWEGAITKKEVYRPKYSEDSIEFTTNPFYLSVSPFQTEDSFHGFRVTAKYVQGDVYEVEPIEVGRTGSLDVGELEPIVRGQIPNIIQSAQS